MSWDSYVEAMVGCGCTGAAIVGLDGSIWATCKLKLLQHEPSTLLKGLENPELLQSHGIFANGTYYLTVLINPTFAYGRKGPSGIVVERTNTALLILTHDETLQSGECTRIAGSYGNYLRDLGY